MLAFEKILPLWGKESFDSEFKRIIESMGVAELPLQAGLSSSNIALENDLKVIILKKYQADENYIVKVAVFYFGVVAGCNCADDPSPADTQNEYCEIEFTINAKTGEAVNKLLTA